LRLKQVASAEQVYTDSASRAHPEQFQTHSGMAAKWALLVLGAHVVCIAAKPSGEDSYILLETPTAKKAGRPLPTYRYVLNEAPADGSGASFPEGLAELQALPQGDPDVPNSAFACSTLAELDRWRAIVRSQIARDTPESDRAFAFGAVEQEYADNRARILADQARQASPAMDANLAALSMTESAEDTLAQQARHAEDALERQARAKEAALRSDARHAEDALRREERAGNETARRQERVVDERFRKEERRADEAFRKQEREADERFRHEEREADERSRREKKRAEDTNETWKSSPPANSRDAQDGKASLAGDAIDLSSAPPGALALALAASVSLAMAAVFAVGARCRDGGRSSEHGLSEGLLEQTEP